MRTFIATIGWTEWPIASALLKHGLSKGDRIILLSPEKRDERSKEAINEVKGFVSRFVPGVNVHDIQVPVYDPVEAIAFLAKRINSEAKEGRRLIVNLSGGMRILVTEVLLALTLLRISDLDLEIRTEDKVDLSIPKVWMQYPDFSNKEVMVLSMLANGEEVSLSELAKRLRVSVSTMHRVLKRMEENGVVASKRVSKERIAGLTLKGRVLSKLFRE
jgi:CRISPR locus-related DNA-binding protein